MTIATQGVEYGLEPLYRTQKAKGIKALKDSGFKVPEFAVYEIEQFVESNLGFGKLSPDVLIGRFVRPCPMVPRHGFVDSRPIRNTQEAEQIIAETYAVEHEAELVSMPVVNADYSAIFTNGKLIVGPNNDGATAGIGSRVIPTIGKPHLHDYKWSEACERAGITEEPFAELLWNKISSEEYYCSFVQLRNGPKVPDVRDFIPAETVVKKIVQCITAEIDGKPAVVDENGVLIDLVAWETTVKTFTPGTVVYFPGGTLAAHIGIHCFLSNVPVVTTFKPEVGQTLKQLEAKPEQSIDKIKAGFVLGCNAKISYKVACYAMLAGCHSITAWSGRQDVLLGFALGCCYRLLITAGLGEYRHSPKRERARKPHRDSVYSHCWNKILAQTTRAKYCKSIDSFANEPWGASFGGKNWLLLTGYAGLIFNSLLDGSIKSALENLNLAVNCSHNGGWGFNKFVSEATMSEAAESPAAMLLRCAPELYQAILADEGNPKLASWFVKRKHYDLSELDGIENKSFKSEELDESCNCGECNCGECNPDGDCGNSDCDYCYPDHDSEPKTSKTKLTSGPIVSAQVKIVENNDNTLLAHIQYRQQTMASGLSHLTKNITVSGGEVYLLKQIASKTSASKLSHTGSKTEYFPLVHSGNSSYWVLGELGIHGFYFKLLVNE